MTGKAIRMAAGAALLAAAPAGAVPFDRVFVFGDSLSDTGRVYELTRGAIPQSPPYYDGRFSNGPVWVERLAPLIGSQPDQKTNCAYGGAETGTLAQTGVPGIQGQVGQFLLSRPGGTGGGLFAVWAGGNDYFNRVSAGSDPSGLVTQTVGNIVTTVTKIEAGVVHDERAAFARDDILGFVEADTCERAERPEEAAMIGRPDCLCRILDQHQSMAARDIDDLAHLAANARVVDDADGAGTVRDGGFNQLFVKVLRIRPDVDEDGHGATQNEGIRRAGEGEGRHYDFIAGTDLGEKASHFER